MRENTACYNFFASWFGTDLFMAVERSKDITHVFLLLSNFAVRVELSRTGRQSASERE